MNVYESLIEIGIRLSSEKDLDKLLDLILNSAREISNSDAGTLYLKEEDKLRFKVFQNDTLERKLGKNEFKKLLSPRSLHISEDSIAGWCAKTGKIMRIEDVYDIDTLPFSFDKTLDENAGYRCRSILAVPMKDRADELVGIFQLINKKENDEVKSFTEEDEKVAEALSSQAAVAIRSAQLTRELKSAHMETILKLGRAAEFKDKETGDHIKRVAEVSRALAETMGKDSEYTEAIFYASPLHDVGKIGIPDRILLKPGKLNAEEWKIMKSHTVLGYELLKDSNYHIIKEASRIARTHHERWDGEGYPRGLSGEEIPLTGRIVALADFFDALLSSRPYRKEPFSLEDTFRIIKEERGTHFDPQVVDAFFDTIEEIKEIHERHSGG